MTQIVTDENGVIHSFPDDATPLEMNNAINTVNNTPTFASRVTQDLKNRAATAGQSVFQGLTGQQGLPSTALQIAGQGYGAAGDIAGEGIKSAISTLPDAVTVPANAAAQSVADSVDKSAPSIGDMLLKGKDILGDISNSKNEVAKDLTAGANIAMTAPVLDSAASSLKDGVSAAANTGDNIFTNNMGKVVKDIPLSAPQLGDMASRSYDAADALGGVLNPGAVNKFVDGTKSILPQTEAGQIASGTSPLTNLLDNLQALKDKPLSLRGAQEFDSGIGNMIENEVDPVTGKVTPVGRQLYQLQGQFRDMIKNATPDDMITQTQYTPSDFNDAMKEQGKLQDLHDNLVKSVQENVQFNETPWGNWRNRNITNAGDDAKNLANVRSQLAANNAKIQTIGASIAQAPETANAALQSKAAFDAWKEGSGLYATSMRANDIERIINRASMMDNPVTGIKTGFRTLANNGGKMNGYLPAEQEAIKNAADTGFVQNALRTGGSKLISSLVGSQVGGLPGAAIGYGAGRGFAAIADKMQYGKATDVMKLLSNRPTVLGYQ